MYIEVGLETIIRIRKYVGSIDLFAPGRKPAVKRGDGIRKRRMLYMNMGFTSWPT